MFNNSSTLPLWGDYFLDIAEAVAKRASCYRAQVGCVLVKDKQIISTGYNGAPAGRTNCLDRGYCYRENKSIESGRLLEECHACGAHAESNAIVNAARRGVSTEGSVLYLSGHDFICVSCQSIVLNAGIEKVVVRRRDGKKLFLCPRDDFFSHPILDLL